MKWADRWRNSYSRKRRDSDSNGYSSSDQSSYYENSSDGEWDIENDNNDIFFICEGGILNWRKNVGKDVKYGGGSKSFLGSSDKNVTIRYRVSFLIKYSK